MVERLLRLSLENRFIVLALATALLLTGAYRAGTLGVDVFPDLTAPRVTVVTESTGLATEEVESLLTYPIETALNGTSGVRRVRSASAPGISVIWAEFDWDTPVTLARQRITERLQSIGGALPPGAGPPLLAPASSVMGEILFVAFTSDKLSPIALRRLVDIRVRRPLLGVDGVAQVVSIGGEVKQYQILAEPHLLEPYGLSLKDLGEAIEAGNQNAPGGYLIEGGQESVVRILGRSGGVEELNALVVGMRDGMAIRLRDVAKVQEGPAIARGTASYNGEAAVLLSVVKQPGADTLSTTRRVDDALDGLEGLLIREGISLKRDVFRQQDFIDTALSNVLSVLFDGALLVVVVLFVFLFSLRPTLISVVAIPLSLVVAVWVLAFFGFSIDTMTLGGLAIAMGELVDDAIVDVENVARRLRARALLPEAKRPPLLKVVFEASMEIRAAIVSATYILLLVFVPLLFLGGLEGRLLQPLAVAYLSAIFASLLVAITVTPVLCSYLLPHSAQTLRAEEPPLMRRLHALYEPLLRRALAQPRWVLSMALVVVGMGGLGFLGLGRTFLPEFNEGSITINMVLTPGTALHQSNALATMAERALLEDPGVLSVGRRTGRSAADEHILGVESTEMEVRIKADDGRRREHLFADIRERLKVVPAHFTLGQPISHRIEHMISGQRSALSVKVFGDDLRVLRRVAREAKALMAQVPGVVDLGVEQVVDIPQWVVDVDPQRASAYGFSAGQAAEAIGIALWGTRAGQVYEEGTATDIILKYRPHSATDLPSLRRLPIPTPSGALVPISALADIRRDSGPNVILRENVGRRVVVTANIAGGDVRGVYQAVRQKLDRDLDLPSTTRLAYAGLFEREKASSRRLLFLGALALLGIAFIVCSTLRSIRRGLIVLVNLPLALAGGVVGVYLCGGVLSVATTIGFITLFGIATRNGILLATRCHDLEAAGVSLFEAIQQSSQERLAPILMTATTAALGLLPLALALGQPGTEIQAPMAWVILTGLATSTALNMFVVPVLLFYGGAVEKGDREEPSPWRFQNEKP